MKKSNVKYILEPEEFVDTKITGLDEAASFERAAICMQNCQLPVDVVKRVMSTNVRELQ